MANYDPIFDVLMKKEGGFQNASTDVGNFCDGKLVGTNFGVSAVAYKSFYGKCPTEAQMRALTRDEAKKIWKAEVWDKIKADSLKTQGIAELMLDSAGGGSNGYLHIRQAINKSYGTQKVSESKKMLLDANEVNLINQADQIAYFKNLYDIRLNYFKNHSQYAIYGQGWIARLNQVYNSSVEEIKKKSQA